MAVSTKDVLVVTAIPTCFRICIVYHAQTTIQDVANVVQIQWEDLSVIIARLIIQ